MLKQLAELNELNRNSNSCTSMKIYLSGKKSKQHLHMYSIKSVLQVKVVFTNNLKNYFNNPPQKKLLEDYFT